MCLLSRTVVPIVADRAIVHDIGDDPVPVVEGPTHHLDIAGGNRTQGGPVSRNGLVKDLPDLALVRERGGLHPLLRWMDHHVADVRPWVLRQEGLLSGVKIECHQCPGVPVAAVDHVQNHARLIESDRGCGQRVLRGDTCKRCPPSVFGRPEHLAAAVRQDAQRKTNTIIPVGDEAGEPLVLLDETPLPRADVDTVEIVKPGIAIVERDQNFGRELRADLLESGLHTFQGSEIFGFAGFQVYTVQPPVLIAALVLDEKNMVVCVGPIVEADATVSIPRDRPRRRRIIGRPDPDVEDACYRGKVANLGPIGAELH